MMTAGDQDVAVIGMAGRFPGAEDIDRLWDNLAAGAESISVLSDRDLEEAGVDRATWQRPDYVRAAALLDGYDMFDARFFGYSPREAALIDPQQRVFLESAWTALEHAGYDASRDGGSIGVYAGAAFNTYLYATGAARQLGESYLPTIIANDKDFLTTRVSYQLGLRGPSLTVQTACSTSLVAVHLACQALLDGECDMALAGGVAVRVPQRAGYLYQPDGPLSPDGHCRAFDARAQGTLFGSGVGVVVLKPLADALTDRDTVWAVIKGSAVNNDGSAKAGYAAPSVTGQVEVVAEALAHAQVDADTISYVEAHGTGTALGDPIEVTALTKAFRRTTSRRGYCAIGSVKTNLGHLDAAAGVAGLIKTILALRHGVVPPTLHFEAPNPRIDFPRTPFFVNASPLPWPAGERPRRAGVSSLGIGGTNAHVVVEEAAAAPASGPSRPDQLLVLSARTEPALDAAAGNVRVFLERNPTVDIADVAYTLQVGRRAFGHRLVVVCRDHATAVAALARPPRGAATAPSGAGGAWRRDDGDGSLAPQVSFLLARPPRGAAMTPPGVGGAWRRDDGGGSPDPQVSFLLPGGGSRIPKGVAELHATEPVFRDRLEDGLAALRSLTGHDLRHLVLPDGTPPPPAHVRPSVQLPLVFLIGRAVAALWLSWGVRPAALVGHSTGEITAAHLAGVLSFADALGMVYERARLLERAPGGMLSVDLPEEEVRTLLAGRGRWGVGRSLTLGASYGGRWGVAKSRWGRAAGLDLACVNTPNRCVVSGTVPAIEALSRRLGERGIETARVPIGSAAHSRLLDPILGSFQGHVAGLALKPPSTPFLSNLTGTWVTDGEATDPGYWARQLRGTVRFSDCVRQLLADRDRVFVEVGPGHTLSGFVRAHPGQGGGRLVVPSLPHAASGRPAPLCEGLGRLWLAGVDVDWAGFSASERRRRVPLPTYPFERRRHWFGEEAATPSLGPPARVTRRPGRPGPPDSPPTPTERGVAEIWREVLGVVDLSTDADFFALGGSSMMVTDVMSRVNRRYGTELSLLTLMESPTVVGLAACIDAVRG